MSEYKYRKPKTCVEKDVKIIASSQFSISTPNPDDSKFMVKKRSQLETRKRMVPKKPYSFKSKDKKQGISDNPRKLGSIKRKRAMIDDLYYDDDAKISIMDRADEVVNNIPAKYPCFLKHMLPSNVSYSFWLILPGQFCKLYLPREDAKVILVDECGKEKETKYLVDRHGLSAGWRGFSMDHRLRKGDILIFHLVSPCKLKVNIIRVYGLDVVDAALRLMHFHACGCRKDSELEDHVVRTSRTHKKEKKRVKTLLLSISQHKEPHNDQGSPNCKLGLIADRYESQGESAEVPEVVDSGITTHGHSNELGYRGSYLIQKHFRKGIDCW